MQIAWAEIVALGVTSWLSVWAPMHLQPVNGVEPVGVNPTSSKATAEEMPSAPDRSVTLQSQLIATLLTGHVDSAMQETLAAPRQPISVALP